LHYGGKKNTVFLRKRVNQLSLKVLLKTKDTNQYVEARALIDSGCTGCAIDRDLLEKIRSIEESYHIV